MLLNIPPDKRGLLHESDVALVKKLGEHIAKSNAQLLKVKAVDAPRAEKNCAAENMLEYGFDDTSYDPIGYYMPEDEQKEYCITFDLDGLNKINRMRIAENTAFSQRVEKYSIYAYVKGKRKKVFEGTTIGYNRIAVFKPVVTDRVQLVLEEVRRKPCIEFAGIYEDNGYKNKKPLFFKLKTKLHLAIYKSFIDKENKFRRKHESDGV